MGIKFGLNDVNEFQILLIEPRATKYLFTDTRRGDFSLYRKGHSLFVREAFETVAAPTGAHLKDRYFKYDPRQKKLLIP